MLMMSSFLDGRTAQFIKLRTQFPVCRIPMTRKTPFAGHRNGGEKYAIDVAGLEEPRRTWKRYLQLSKTNKLKELLRELHVVHYRFLIHKDIVNIAIGCKPVSNRFISIHLKQPLQNHHDRYGVFAKVEPDNKAQETSVMNWSPSLAVHYKWHSNTSRRLKCKRRPDHTNRLT